MSLEKINGIAPSQNKDSQVKDSKKSKLDRAGEEAIFPNLTVFTNEKVSEFMKGIDEKETTYDLFDDKTGELSTELNKWEETYLEAEYNNKFMHDAKYIEKDSSNGVENFKYDSNGDGEYETEISFYGNHSTYKINNGDITMSYTQELFRDKNNEKLYGDIVKFEYEDRQGKHGFSESEFPADNKNRLRFYSKSEAGSDTTDSGTVICYDENGKANNQ